MASTKTQEQRTQDFILRLEKLYPDYKLISGYVDSRTKVILKHKDGYEWIITPRFLDGKRHCPEVAKKLKETKGTVRTKKLTHEEYLEKFYSKWSKEEYEVIGSYTKMTDIIEVKHLKCGKSFFPTANNMIYTNKKGCTHCYSKQARTVESTNQELKKIGIDEYECLEVQQKGGHSHGLFRHNCKLCENYEFTMRITDMLSKHNQRCPKCSILEQESKAVREIKKYLEDNNIKYQQEIRYETCKHVSTLPFDFYLEEYDLLIEYDGEQHFIYNEKGYFTEDRVKQTQLRDKIKTQWCRDNNKDLLRINYKQNHLDVLDKYLKKNYEII